MNKAILVGRQFGKLTAIEYAYSNKGRYWKCQCECGNTTYVKTAHLRNGHTKSCGCLQKATIGQMSTKHELCNTPTYRTWDSMIQRCKNHKHINYQRYGGRGIKVCDNWLKFEGFIEEMGLRPPKFTLDRIDNNKGYFKENCRWVSQKRQANNTSKNVNITYDGETHTVSEWAQKLNMSRSTLNNRLFRSKWSIKDAFTKGIM